MDIINDPSTYLELVKNNLENSWLKQEFEKVEKYYKTKKNTRVLGDIKNYANPLALLIYQAEKNISERRTNSNILISNETVDITRLGTYIDLLKSNNVTGFKEKFNELKLSDNKNFEKIINELNFAGGFAKSNHTVEFIKTQPTENQRTPDLLIDGNIEVECKKKDKLTKRDIQNNDLWNRLQSKSIELMNNFKRFYLIYAYFEKDPTSQIIKKILKELRKAIQSGKDIESKVDGINIIANKICENNEVFPIGIQVQNKSELKSILDPNLIDKAISQRISKPEIINYEKIRPDYDHTPSTFNIMQNGSVVAKGTMKFLFKAKEAPDRLKSIISSIKNAKGQLSGKKIGIICVNITHISEKFMDKDRELLGLMLRNVLQNNSKISAVAITSEFYTRDKNGIRYQHQASIIRNENANHPLPENFVILN